MFGVGRYFLEHLVAGPEVMFVRNDPLLHRERVTKVEPPGGAGMVLDTCDCFA